MANPGKPRPSLPLFEQRRDQGRGASRAVRLDRPIIDVLPDRLGDRGCDRLRRLVLEVHMPSGAVAVESVAYVEVLLEVVTGRK